MPLLTLIIVGMIILGIASLSLYFSYIHFTSPAFSAEFGFALKDKEEFNSNQVKKISKRGIWIELGRVTLFVFMAIIMLHWAYPDCKLPRGPFAWITLSICLAVTVALSKYHFKKAPKNLKDESKHWPKFKSQESVWEINAYWKEIFNDQDKRKKTDIEGEDEYDRMYKRPYRSYFPYSFIIYVLILIPVFSISVYQAWTDYQKNEHFLSNLTNNYNAAQSYETQRSLINDLMVAYTNIKLSLHHYSCLLLFLAIAAAYESIIGYRTLAKSAQKYSWAGYASILLALIMILPNIITLGHHNQNIETSLIMSYAERNFASPPREQLISRDLFNSDLDEIKKYSTTNLLLDIRNSDLAVSLLLILFGNRIIRKYLQ